MGCKKGKTKWLHNLSSHNLPTASDSSPFDSPLWFDRFQAEGVENVVVNSVHPGVILTNLLRHASKGLKGVVFGTITHFRPTFNYSAVYWCRMSVLFVGFEGILLSRFCMLVVYVDLYGIGHTCTCLYRVLRSGISWTFELVEDILYSYVWHSLSKCYVCLCRFALQGGIAVVLEDHTGGELCAN